MAVSGSTVYAGGAFWTIAGQTRNYIAALNAATGAATAWNPNAGFFLFSSELWPHVYALAATGSAVYAGGDFGTIGGQMRKYFAEFRGGAGFVFNELPQGGTFQAGDSLHVAFTGNIGQTTIQWRRNGFDIPGATTDTFEIPTLEAEDSGQYDVVVTDESLAVYTTSPVAVTVSGEVPALGLIGLMSLASVIALAGLRASRRE